jgi:Tfp pilus assembly protein PilO
LHPIFVVMIIHFILILGWLFHYQLQDEILLDEWVKTKQYMQTFRLPNKQINKCIYNLQEHLQREITKMRCNVRLECKLKCSLV